MLRRLAITFLLQLTLTIPVCTQSTNRDSRSLAIQSIEQRLNREVETGGYPSLSVGIVREDKLLYAKSFGVADRTSKRQPTPATLYRIGSVTKVFTATLLASLRDQGIVQLDDPVSKYLPPEVKLPTDPRGAPAITLRHLATHTSGLPVGTTNPVRVYEVPAPDVVERYRAITEVKLEFPVGARFQYSNLGYWLIGHALERAAGKPYEALLKERIFKPLGMNNSTLTLSSEQRALVALPYSVDNTPISRPDGGDRFYAPAGQIFSSVDELAKFISLQFRAGEINVTPLRGSTLWEMQTPQRLQNSWNFAIGLGWWIEHTDDLGDIVWHLGANNGYSSFVGFSPSQKVGVIVLTNRARSVEAIGKWLMAEALKSQKSTQ